MLARKLVHCRAILRLRQKYELYVDSHPSSQDFQDLNKPLLGRSGLGGSLLARTV